MVPPGAPIYEMLGEYKLENEEWKCKAMLLVH
jgi:hypothetical protein